MLTLIPTLASDRTQAPARGVSVRWQLAFLLLAHVLLWTWAGVASRSNFDAPGDMVEAYAWAQGWQWGYYKHPPLSAWATGLWFSVMPESHAGFAMLAAFNGAIGLAGLAFLAREFLPARWVLLTVVVASLTPGITSLAMRFNANAILISSWPWAVALFVRMMHRGRLKDAVLCGVVCALAMLGKYYSAVLLATLVTTALWLPHWRARLLMKPFLVAVLVFAACMTPHLLWLFAQQHGPLQYAQAATGMETRGTSALRALNFALAHWAFPVVALVAFLAALNGPLRWRAAWASLWAPLRPRSSELWLLGVLPVVATMLGTILTGARTAWIWGLPISAGLALLATSRAHEMGATLNLRRMWRAVAVVWVVVILAAPLWWWLRALYQSPAVSEPREEMALTVDALWDQENVAPLRFISGTRALAASVAFYAPSHPRYWSMWNATRETPWINLDDVKRHGGVIVCALEDKPCETLALSWSTDARPVRVAKKVRGLQFPTQLYRVFIIPVSPVVAP
jgi:4-amino-4-deoxy-L-arabinose transferase-like glycosyltransferase